MQIHFQSLERAKKTAKVLAALIDDLKLSKAQEAIATITGYRDWHDLAKHCDRHLGEMPTPIQIGALEQSGAISLTHKLSKRLSLSIGDAFYALVQLRLPGIHVDDAEVYEALWIQLFQETQNLQSDKRSPGKVVTIKSDSPGWTGRQAILKKFGSSTYLIVHETANAQVADFEVVLPRKPLPLFVPARLKFAYGCWTEASGSKVLFSRDYNPLWRLTEGRKPERLQPWIWIDMIDEQWYWDDSNPPWYSVQRQNEEEQRLRHFGIHALPKLADTLPDLVFNKNAIDVLDGVKLMADREAPGTAGRRYR